MRLMKKSARIRQEWREREIRRSLYRLHRILHTPTVLSHLWPKVGIFLLHFPLRGGFMLRLMACIHLAGTLGHRFSEKSQFSSFSTRRGVRCVKNARNPQRIPALFALRPLTPCEKVEHFFVFRNALKTAAGSFFLTLSIELD